LSKDAGVLGKLLPSLVFILLGIILWWSPDFLTADTYFNIGDSLFPFRSYEQIGSSFYAWQEQGKEGLGSNITYPNAMALYYYALVFFLRSIRLPLWVCNRLFFLIPTWILFFSSFYMVNAFIAHKKNQWGSILGSIFIATAPPLMFITPILHLAVSGMILSLGSFKNFLNSKKKRNFIIFALGFLMMTSMPRYMYIFVIAITIYLFSWLSIIYKRIHKKRIFFLKTVWISLSLMILILMINFYTVLPALSFLFKHSSAEFLPNNDIYINRLDVVNFYRGTTSLIYSLRLVNSNVYSLYNNYFSSPINLLCSFLLIAIMFVPFVLKKNINREMLTVCLTTVVLMMLVAVFGSDFYKFMMENIPGFWILNNPQYVLTPIVPMYGVLLAYSVNFGLRNIKNMIIDKKREKIAVVGILMCIFFLIVVNNGVYFFDKLPLKRKIFITNEKDIIAMGNHLPYFKIPAAYKKLNEKIGAEEKNARTIVLPFLTDGYARFSWWPYRTMPDVLYSLTDLRLAGASFGPSNTIVSLRNFLLNKKLDKAFDLMSKYGYSYIFMHKDLLAYNSFFEKELSVYLAEIKKHPRIKMVEENDYFQLVKLLPKKEKRKKKPEIIFKKIHPAKYIAVIRKAEEPFWLIFDESFNAQWKLYRIKKDAIHADLELSVAAIGQLEKEANPIHDFFSVMADMRYLFQNALNARHKKVDTFKNGWLIDPEEMGLGSNFNLVVFFQPQSLFCLGLIVSLLGVAVFFILFLFKKI